MGGVLYNRGADAVVKGSNRRSMSHDTHVYYFGRRTTESCYYWALYRFSFRTVSVRGSLPQSIYSASGISSSERLLPPCSDAVLARSAAKSTPMQADILLVCETKP